MAKNKKSDYPLRLCSTCAAEYAAGGFRVSVDKNRGMIVNNKCDFCGRHVPVYACRITGRGAPKRRK